jgi:hypothetical protein
VMNSCNKSSIRSASVDMRVTCLGGGPEQVMTVTDDHQHLFVKVQENQPQGLEPLDA